MCPRCGQNGFLSGRPTRGSYFPKVASVNTMAFESYYTALDKGREISPYLRQRKEASEGRVRMFEFTGNLFIDEENNCVYEYASTTGPGTLGRRHYVKMPQGSKDKRKKKNFSRGPEIRYYVGHYDPKKYHEKMEQYKEGKIKSKPNGRKWCFIDSRFAIILAGKDFFLPQFYELRSSLRTHYQTQAKTKLPLPVLNIAS